LNYAISFAIVGGSSSQGENGGPGVSYFEGSQISNLRVDNGCQQPQVLIEGFKVVVSLFLFLV
jgi:hypothetical protein